MGGVARDQFQAVLRAMAAIIGSAAADGPPDTFQIAGDLACQSAVGLVERQDFFAAMRPGTSGCGGCFGSSGSRK